MRHSYPLIVLVATLLVGASSAANITLSTDQKDYYFPLGSDAQIQVNISNTYDHPLQGMLRSSTTESTRTAGLSMSSSYSQSQVYVAPQGDSMITIDGGTSDSEKDLAVSLSFDYTDTAPASQVLGDIMLHFVRDTSKTTNTKQQVVSQSAPPGQGSPGASSGSYQTIQQMMMQQMPGISQQQSLQDNQIPEDSSALKQQLQAEQERTRADQDNFTNTLMRDPTFRSVNGSLASQGFISSSLKVDPISGDTGTFSSEYTKATGERVSVTGSLRNGTAGDITERTGYPLLPPGPFENNSSYKDSGRGLENEGFSRSGTVITNTPAGISVNQSYQNPQGRRAYLNATGSLADVTSVTVERERVETNYLLPGIAVLIIAILAIVAYLIYRRYRKEKPVSPPVPAVSPPQQRDFRKEAESLLREAEDQHKGHLYRDAFGTTGQALRLYLSYRFGNGAEITNTEAISLLEGSQERTRQIKNLLDRCTLVEFAKAEPEPGEFEKYVEFTRNFIRE